jgi:hypothetical protein
MTTPAYLYDQQKMMALFARIIEDNTATIAWEWLQQKIKQADDSITFASAFIQIPRKINRSIIVLTDQNSQLISDVVDGFTIEGWTTDRLCRVWLLLHLDITEEKQYAHRIENLFEAAEVNEQVALYSALPLLAYPQQWQKRCSEGIRSNIGDVLSAIMLHNPYPATHLNEPAWNQMVLKAFFTEKKVEEITGLDDRANPELANILIDYAHERWAAHRSVNPQLWRCVGRFISNKNFPDIERVFQSENRTEKAAAALACADSTYAPARLLLDENPSLKKAIEAGSLTWDTLEQKSIPVH